MECNQDIMDLIRCNAMEPSIIMQRAMENSVQTMLQDGIQKALEGYRGIYTISA